MTVKALGYIGLGSSDPAAWLRFGIDMLGMMPARAVPGEGWGPAEDSRIPGVARDGTVFLKMDDRQWRIAIHPTDGARELLYMGLELEDHLALERCARMLRDEGHEVRPARPEEIRARAVTGLFFTQDPAGNALEFFYGATTDYNFASPVPGQRFLAGHLGLGHVNLFVDNQAACFDFYTRLLGFRLSDYIRYGEEAALQFLRCNPRHHSIAMLDFGVGNTLQHLMVEMETIDDVGKALDRAKKLGFATVSSLGRHRNDGTLSFYMRSPGTVDVEIGCEGKILDETWTANEFCEGDVWGHDGLVEAVMEAGDAARRKVEAGSR